jgi:hypothetical protein
MGTVFLTKGFSAVDAVTSLARTPTPDVSTGGGESVIGHPGE